jgi:hypothetical protein
MCILSGLNTLPAILNNRSTGAEEAGTDKYFVANFASIGNLIFIYFLSNTKEVVMLGA